jgi:hypothetical protein
VVFGDARIGLSHNRMRTSQDERSAMNEIIFIAEPDPGGGYAAHALGHSIFTEADT